MRSILLIITTLVQIQFAICQIYSMEDLFGKWIISDDTIECSSDRISIEKNSDKSVIFYKDGTLKCSDKKDVFFGDITYWNMRDNRLSFKHANGRVSTYSSKTMKDSIVFVTEINSKACRTKEHSATLHRKITHNYNARRIEIIGENEVVEESKVDERPQFKGGEAKKLEWLAKHMKIPKTDTIKPLKITVLFTVNKLGKVVNPMVWGKDLSPELAKKFEAIVLTMPKWLPAKIEGVKVNSLVSVSTKIED